MLKFKNNAESSLNNVTKFINRSSHYLGDKQDFDVSSEGP